MQVDIFAQIMAGLLWLSLIAFAVLGGADFGAGVWDLLAWGRHGGRVREALIRAIGPVWEANEIWLIFLVTGTFTAFPIVFSGLSIALFIPLVLALIGTVLRGAAFAYYSHFRAAVRVNLTWGRVFSIVSVITPFLFGAAAAAVVSGNIHVHDGQVTASYWSTWTTPFALACGAFALGMCSVLAATYMTVEARDSNQQAVAVIFRRNALISGAVTALVGAIAAWLASIEAPYLWENLTTRALPLSLAAVVIGLLTAAALLVGYFRLARVLVAAEVACILGAWAVAQLPYLIVPDVTIASAASPTNVQTATLIGATIGLAIVMPSLWYLLYVFKARNVQPRVSAAAWADSLAAPAEPEAPTGTAEEPPNPSARTADQGGRARNRHLVVTALELFVGLLIPFVTDALRRFWYMRRYRSRHRTPNGRSTTTNEASEA